MAKTVAVVIQEDPKNTNRPVEALRIALGLVAGSHATTVILLGQAICLVSKDIDDIVDTDILEKYLPSVEQLEIPFILQNHADRSDIRREFHIRYETDENIRYFIQSMDRTLVF
jgi:sulfur relay (sulfurtransferase) DsrF/TusC family protein